MGAWHSPQASPMLLLFWGRGMAHPLVSVPGKFLAVHRKAGNMCFHTPNELLSLRDRQVEQLFLNHVINGRQREVDALVPEVGKVRWR